MSNPALGIGVITYSRLEKLKECLQAIERYTTSSYTLVIADDGSQDGTVEWAREAGYRVITGTRRGCAWNKNRALYDLLTRTDSDPILLLEDDTIPNSPGWEIPWMETARRWQHVNYSLSPSLNGLPNGSETPASPLQCTVFGGQCTATTRQALERIGYFDARFMGYGYEHVEWTHRFRWHYDQEWNLPPGAMPCLTTGITVDWTHSWYDAETMKYNERINRMLRAEPLYRSPWHHEEERVLLERELEAVNAVPTAG